ncbi:hypothetical protein OMK64_09280 [Cellulomonas fimi]|uniref:hypothetical protein n=1 Tax=Cellulomonas fimi TaxID=1708 RepID=UPI00234C8EF9|nr:hypothetical protein [Cellulomonas fimi]MDC7121728.1 hypothetical protein [Cellulomonas fimi]
MTGDVRVGYYVVVEGAQFACEAPFSAQVRALSTRFDDDPERTATRYDRLAVDRVFHVEAWGRWRGADATLQTVRTDGVVVAGVGPAPEGDGVRHLSGGQWQAVVDPAELDDVRERERDVLRCRPGWVAGTGPDATRVGTYALIGDEVLPCGEPLEGLLPVGYGLTGDPGDGPATGLSGDRLVALADVRAMETVTTTASWQGRRVGVAVVERDTALVSLDDGSTEVVALDELTLVAEEVRPARVPTAPVRAAPSSGRSPRLPPGSRPAELAAWVSDGGPAHRELRDLVAAVYASADADGVAALVRALPRLRVADPAADAACGYRRLDWTLRVATATWVAAAGLRELAASIADAAPVVDDETAVALLEPVKRALAAMQGRVVETTNGPADEWQEVEWRAARKGGRADALVAVSKTVCLVRAVGRGDGRLAGAVASVCVRASEVRAAAARVVARRGVDPGLDLARYPLGDAFRRSALDLVRAATRPGA